MVTEALDIGIKRPGIHTPTIIMVMIFMIMKVLDCLQVIEDVGIVLLIPISKASVTTHIEIAFLVVLTCTLVYSPLIGLVLLY